MAKVSKYTHGKTKGTSDRQSSRRTSAAPGETGGVIQDFRLSGPGERQKIRTNNQDYFRSQPLNVPSAIQIPDALEIPDDSQNLRNLADAFGQVNTRLQAFTSDFWNFQKSMDTAARERAEQRAAEEATGQTKEDKKKSATQKLNKAKNVVEKKAETDPTAANSWPLFHSLDKRTDREYVVVKAKEKGLAAISSYPGVLVEAYKDSFSDEKRADAFGNIEPISPYALEGQADEVLTHAQEYFKNAINNPQAYLELTRTGQIQAAINSGRNQIAQQHAKYTDNKSKITTNTIVSNAIYQSLDTKAENDLGDGSKFSGALTSMAQGSSSLANFQEYKNNFLQTIVNRSVIGIPDNQFINEIQNVRKELLNTKIGPGDNDYLWKQYGSKENLGVAFDLAIAEATVSKTNSIDASTKQQSEKAAQSSFKELVLEVTDSDQNEEGRQTFKIQLPSGDVLQGTDLEAFHSKYRALIQEAQLNMTGVARTSFIQSLQGEYRDFMDGFGDRQQKENYNWIINNLDTKRPVYWKSIIGVYAAKDLINSEQSRELNTLISAEYRTAETKYNNENKKLLTQLERSLDGYYRLIGTEKNITTSDEQALMSNKLSEVNDQLHEIFKDTSLTKEQKSAKAIKYINDEIKTSNGLNTEARQALQGKGKGNTQLGSNTELTINNKGFINNDKGGTTPIYTANNPRQIVNELGGQEQNIGLAKSVQQHPLYSIPVFNAQITALQEEDKRRVKLGITTPLNWKDFSKHTNKGRLFDYIKSRETRKSLTEKRLLVFPEAEVVNAPFQEIYLFETKKILDRLEKENINPKQFFKLQMQIHNLPVNEEMEGILNRLWPDDNNQAFNIENLPGQEIAKVASTDLSWMPAQKVNPKKDLETEMLNVIHSGESTVDTKHGGYEAFNQGGDDEGETVLGFSGTYGDHPANKGKKLTEMTIQEILDIQDSGYDFETYPKGEAGTKKWEDSGGIHAAGRYQLLRGAIRDAMRFTGIKPTEKFTPEIQDRLGLAYLLQYGPSRWTSMEKKDNIKLRKELDKLLDKYNKTDWTKSSTIGGRSDIA